MVDDTVQVPPRTGPGATVEAWEEYARLTGVEVEKGSTRDEIIDAVEAAQVTEPAPEPDPEDVPVGGAEGVAGDTPAPATGDEEDDDADDVPDEEPETPAAQEEEVEEAEEGVTFVVEGQKAPDFARSPNRPKTELVVRLGGKTVQFRGGRLTTSNPTIINALDRLAERHSDGKVYEATRETPDGPETFRKWDSYGGVREDPTLNTYGIRREGS